MEILLLMAAAAVGAMVALLLAEHMRRAHPTADELDQRETVRRLRRLLGYHQNEAGHHELARLVALRERGNALATRLQKAEQQISGLEVADKAAHTRVSRHWDDTVSLQQRVAALEADMDQLYEAETRRARARTGSDTIEIMRPSKQSTRYPDPAEVPMETQAHGELPERAQVLSLMVNLRCGCAIEKALRIPLFDYQTMALHGIDVQAVHLAKAVELEYERHTCPNQGPPA